MFTYFGLDRNDSNSERVCFVKLPALTTESTIKFTNDMWLTASVDSFVFDFSNVGSITPMIMLFLSREIFLFRRARKHTRFSAIKYSHATYAGHMGFFRVCGVPFGKDPGRALGNDSYLPITILDTSEMKKAAADKLVSYGQYVEDVVVDPLVKVLIKDNRSESYRTVSFCLREIMRNVLEHSHSERLIYCAQYWPSRSKASLAIMDIGIGVRESLETNPNLNFNNDLQAIKSALNPGISSKVFGKQKARLHDDWANSGHGLSMASEIGKLGGGFFIGSGDTALEFTGMDVKIHSISIQGTIINLDIDISDLRRLEDITMAISSKWKVSSKIKPSTASMKLMS